MEPRDAIAANVRLVLEQLGPTSGIDFGCNRESVAWLEGFIERQRARPDFDPESLVGVLGSFLGECLVVNTGGRWEQDDGMWSVLFPSGSRAFPFNKIQKQLVNGLENGNSILSFYDVAVNTVATGKLPKSNPS